MGVLLSFRDNADVRRGNNLLPLARTMINLLMQVRHSNMKENARQHLFPAVLQPANEIETSATIEWIFLLTKK